jgi:hypothetical protein
MHVTAHVATAPTMRRPRRPRPGIHHADRLHATRTTPARNHAQHTTLTAVASTGVAQSIAGVMQASPTASRGSLLWPVGVSFVGGTLGAVLGGLWPSLIGGTIGWLLGDVLR